MAEDRRLLSDFFLLLILFFLKGKLHILHVLLNMLLVSLKYLKSLVMLKLHLCLLICFNLCIETFSRAYGIGTKNIEYIT